MARRSSFEKNLRAFKVHLRTMESRGELTPDMRQTIAKALVQAEHAQKTGDVDGLSKALDTIARCFLERS